MCSLTDWVIVCALLVVDPSGQLYQMYFCAMDIISNRNFIVGYQNCDYSLTYEGTLMQRVILPVKAIHQIESSSVL